MCGKFEDADFGRLANSFGSVKFSVEMRVREGILSRSKEFKFV